MVVGGCDPPSHPSSDRPHFIGRHVSFHTTYDASQLTAATLWNMSDKRTKAASRGEREVIYDGREFRRISSHLDASLRAADINISRSFTPLSSRRGPVGPPGWGCEGRRGGGVGEEPRKDIKHV